MSKRATLVEDLLGAVGKSAQKTRKPKLKDIPKTDAPTVKAPKKKRAKKVVEEVAIEPQVEQQSPQPPPEPPPVKTSETDMQQVSAVTAPVEAPMPKTKAKPVYDPQSALAWQGKLESVKANPESISPSAPKMKDIELTEEAWEEGQANLLNLIMSGEKINRYKITGTSKGKPISKVIAEKVNGKEQKVYGEDAGPDYDDAGNPLYYFDDETQKQLDETVQAQWSPNQISPNEYEIDYRKGLIEQQKLEGKVESLNEDVRGEIIESEKLLSEPLNIDAIDLHHPAMDRIAQSVTPLPQKLSLVQTIKDSLAFSASDMLKKIRSNITWIPVKKGATGQPKAVLSLSREMAPFQRVIGKGLALSNSPLAGMDMKFLKHFTGYLYNNLTAAQKAKLNIHFGETRMRLGRMIAGLKATRLSEVKIGESDASLASTVGKFTPDKRIAQAEDQLKTMKREAKWHLVELERKMHYANIDAPQTLTGFAEYIDAKNASYDPLYGLNWILDNDSMSRFHQRAIDLYTRFSKLDIEDPSQRINISGKAAKGMPDKELARIAKAMGGSDEGAALKDAQFVMDIQRERDSLDLDLAKLRKDIADVSNELSWKNPNAAEKNAAKVRAKKQYDKFKKKYREIGLTESRSPIKVIGDLDKKVAQLDKAKTALRKIDFQLAAKGDARNVRNPTLRKELIKDRAEQMRLIGFYNKDIKEALDFQSIFHSYPDKLKILSGLEDGLDEINKRIEYLGSNANPAYQIMKDKIISTTKEVEASGSLSKEEIKAIALQKQQNQRAIAGKLIPSEDIPSKFGLTDIEMLQNIEKTKNHLKYAFSDENLMLEGMENLNYINPKILEKSIGDYADLYQDMYAHEILDLAKQNDPIALKLINDGIMENVVNPPKGSSTFDHSSRFITPSNYTYPELNIIRENTLKKAAVKTTYAISELLDKIEAGGVKSPKAAFAIERARVAIRNVVPKSWDAPHVDDSLKALVAVVRATDVADYIQSNIKVAGDNMATLNEAKANLLKEIGTSQEGKLHDLAVQIRLHQAKGRTAMVDKLSKERANYIMLANHITGKQRISLKRDTMKEAENLLVSKASTTSEAQLAGVLKMEDAWEKELQKLDVALKEANELSKSVDETISIANRDELERQALEEEAEREAMKSSQEKMLDRIAEERVVDEDMYEADDAAWLAKIKREQDEYNARIKKEQESGERGVDLVDEDSKVTHYLDEQGNSIPKRKGPNDKGRVRDEDEDFDMEEEGDVDDLEELDDSTTADPGGTDDEE